jgi:hypothetical protein
MEQRTLTSGGPATGCITDKRAAVEELHRLARTITTMGLVSLGYRVRLRPYGTGWAVFVTEPAGVE